MPVSTNKGLAAFFSGALQALGQQGYQKYLTKQQEEMGKRKTIFETETQLAMQKMNDPNTSPEEKLAYRDIYRRHTGNYLPIAPSPAQPVNWRPQDKIEPKLVTVEAQNEKLRLQGENLKAGIATKQAQRKAIYDTLKRRAAAAKDDKLKYQIELLDKRNDNLSTRQKNLVDDFGRITDQTTYGQIEQTLQDIDNQTQALQDSLFRKMPPAIPKPANPFEKFGGTRVK